MKAACIILFFCLCLYGFGVAQNSDSEVPVFPFWQEGIWTHTFTTYNGDTLADKSIYIVEKENDFTYHEKWWLDIGEGQLLPARVTKAYDKETGRWKMFYSDGDYSQLWEMDRRDDQLNFYKAFNFSGNKFLSRQKWEQLPDGRIIRTIERSVDEGKTWRIRYYIELKRRDPE